MTTQTPRPFQSLPVDEVNLIAAAITSFATSNLNNSHQNAQAALVQTAAFQVRFVQRAENILGKINEELNYRDLEGRK